MKRKGTRTNSVIRKLTLAGIVTALAIIGFYLPYYSSEAATAGSPGGSANAGLYRKLVPDVDLNTSRALADVRTATSTQIAALDAIRNSAGASSFVSRWNSSIRSRMENRPSPVRRHRASRMSVVSGSPSTRLQER